MEARGSDHLRCASGLEGSGEPFQHPLQIGPLLIAGGKPPAWNEMALTCEERMQWGKSTAGRGGKDAIPR